MKPRYPVSINGEMLNAIFTKKQQQNTASFMTRLLQSLQVVVTFSKKGLSFVGIRGGADF
jgi:hypothetical protein